MPAKKKTKNPFAAPKGRRWLSPNERISRNDRVLVFDPENQEPRLRKVWDQLVDKTPAVFNVLVLTEAEDNTDLEDALNG